MITKEQFIAEVSPHTMTSIERISALYDALQYVTQNNIVGDFVECGVWRGGNVYGMCRFLNSIQQTDRTVWLYDTFAGMTQPQIVDEAHDYPLCDASIETVKSVVEQANYPNQKIKYVVGDVSQTLDLQENLPQSVAILRLDTDWYQSTKKELCALWPLLSKNGVLIVDDYGHWIGARKAFHDFFDEIQYSPTIEYIDYTGIKVVKQT